MLGTLTYSGLSTRKLNHDYSLCPEWTLDLPDFGCNCSDELQKMVKIEDFVPGKTYSFVGTRMIGIRLLGKPFIYCSRKKIPGLSTWFIEVILQNHKKVDKKNVSVFNLTLYSETTK